MFQTSQKFKIHCTVVGEFIAPSWTSDFVTNIVMVSPGRARD